MDELLILFLNNLKFIDQKIFSYKNIFYIFVTENILDLIYKNYFNKIVKTFFIAPFSELIAHFFCFRFIPAGNI